MQPTETVECKLCGVQFTGIIRKRRKFCSRLCAKKVAIRIALKFLEDPANAAAMAEKRKQFMIGRKPSRKVVEARSKWQQDNRAIIASWCSRTHKGVRETAGRVKRGVNHYKGRRGIFRSPSGKQYEFRNVTQFVRDNEALFAPQDVAWENDGIVCNAAQGLRSLMTFGAKRVRGSWKGWTLVSIYERRFNDGDDLLDRNPPPPNELFSKENL